MDLKETRERIDAVDAQIVSLFAERMELAQDVAANKIALGKAILDPVREREKLAEVAAQAPRDLQDQTIALFSLLMSMNKARQHQLVQRQQTQSKVPAMSTEPFPATASVACQGSEGAYSQQAACKLFRCPSISYFDTFEGVFRAVEDGFCSYGVLPIENSTAGSVNAVYDLMARHNFSIVRSVRLKVSHNLLALPGTSIDSIREVISHEQAINQCSRFIDRHYLAATPVRNTASAAKAVAQNKQPGLAAIASLDCAALYGLEPLAENIQDSDSNYTRFVVIAREPIVYPGANRTSLMLKLKNEPGSLYRALERIFALDINLVKLESRPIPGREFEFLFYFDLECPADTPAFTTMLASLDDICNSYTYFGTYAEML